MQDTDESYLFDSAMQRLDEMIKMGTGAVEIKSGYGLNFENEVKMLKVIKRIKEKSPVPVKANFLGAHAFPLEFKENRQGYIDEICNRMIPYIADNGLADYIDVFCDKGFFSVDDSDKILTTGTKYGLKPKIHANELDISGGVQVGVKTMPSLLITLRELGGKKWKPCQDQILSPPFCPGHHFSENSYAPAREMIDSGLGVAIASDFNPGSSPSGNMNFIISLASIYMKMLPEEAINAATINAAHALELQNDMGGISVGKTANLIITKPLDNIAQIPYFYGSNLIDKVLIKGVIY